METIKVGPDIVRMFTEARGVERLADYLAITPFCLKKAIKVSQKASLDYREVWDAIYNLYPQTRGVKIRYNHEAKEINILN